MPPLRHKGYDHFLMHLLLHQLVVNKAAALVFELDKTGVHQALDNLEASPQPFSSYRV